MHCTFPFTSLACTTAERGYELNAPAACMLSTAVQVLTLFVAYIFKFDAHHFCHFHSHYQPQPCFSCTYQQHHTQHSPGKTTRC
jgi:hypothetical protein